MTPGDSKDSTSKDSTDSKRSTDGSERSGADNQVQGEGNYEAARRYDEKAREFVESGRVDQAARDAEPRSADEAQELQKAEREGKSHARGEESGDDRSQR